MAQQGWWLESLYWWEPFRWRERTISRHYHTRLTLIPDKHFKHTASLLRHLYCFMVLQRECASRRWNVCSIHQTGGGALVLGQDQDQRGDGFNPVESFVGTVSQLNIWNYVLTPQQVTLYTHFLLFMLTVYWVHQERKKKKVFFWTALRLETKHISTILRSGLWPAAVHVICRKGMCLPGLTS